MCHCNAWHSLIGITVLLGVERELGGGAAVEQKRGEKAAPAGLENARDLARADGVRRQMGSPADAASDGIDRIDSMYDDVDQRILQETPRIRPRALARIDMSSFASGWGFEA